MNKGEYGNYLRFNAGEDIALNNNTLHLYSPSPHVRRLVKNSSNGLSVGAIDFDTGSEIYVAGEYVEYRFTATDIDASGIWSVRLLSQTADLEICKISDEIVNFEVDA